MFHAPESQEQTVDFSYLVGKTIKGVYQEAINCVSFWVCENKDGFVSHQVVRLETTPSAIPGVDGIQLVRLRKAENIDA